MADGNVVRTSECKRKDGSITKNFILLIDLKKLSKTTSGQFIKKVGKYHSEILKAEEQGVSV